MRQPCCAQIWFKIFNPSEEDCCACRDLTIMNRYGVICNYYRSSEQIFLKLSNVIKIWYASIYLVDLACTLFFENMAFIQSPY